MWKDGEGESIPITQLSDSHLQNTLRFLAKRSNNLENCLKKYPIVKYMLDEAISRNASIRDREEGGDHPSRFIPRLQKRLADGQVTIPTKLASPREVY